MKDYLKVKGHEGLYRDPSTGAIINTERPPKSSLSNTFNSALDDINILKNEVSEIKNLLRELIRNASNT
jgi:hypothetical protein|tara:strand:- start:7 stop:213 length:207 start_codon:yes stop_codon:yes gene_type:complete